MSASTPFTPGRRVHIIGIGGSGMSAIARILLQRGCRVSGSDSSQSSRLDSLRHEGADVYIGHDSQLMLLRSPEVVVRSTAISEGNVEAKTAVTAGLPLLSRADAVRELMADRFVIEVMGTHGKTTTASMAAMAAMAAGLDASYLVGSELEQTGTNARWAGELAIVEGDESDASGFQLRPRVLIITNIDRDHMDFWPDHEDLIAAFETFAIHVGDSCTGTSTGTGVHTESRTSDVPPHSDSGNQDTQMGLIIACADDAGAARVASTARIAGRRVLTYGTSADADLRICDVTVDNRGHTARLAGLHDVGELRLGLPGLHNLRNAAAVVALAAGLDWPMDSALSALASFRSTRRRFEVMASTDGIRVIDDYAHHPTAVAATIAGAQDLAAAERAAGGPARVVALCQPYRWYRTAALSADYAQALSAADVVLLLDVYGPGEVPIEGVGAEAIASALQRQFDVPALYVGSKEAAVTWVLDNRCAGDVVLTLGGEDIRNVARSLASALHDLTPDQGDSK